MNRTLTRRYLRDYAALAAGAFALLVAFVMFFSFAVRSMPLGKDSPWVSMPWVRRVISALAGMEIHDSPTMQILTTVAFSHPLVWIILIAFLLSMSSGAIAGQIDRGTMDLTGTLPVSRGRMYGSATVSLLAFGGPLCAAVWLGAWLGRRLAGLSEVELAPLAMVTAHLYAAYVFLACFSIAASAMCSRRSTALVISGVVFFYAFVLNLLVGFWPAAGKIAFTGFLNYYRPLPIVMNSAWRWKDLAVLLGAAAAAWMVGLVAFLRRDIPAR